MQDNIPDWLKEAANKHADDVGFRVPYDGSNKFYDDKHVKWAKESFIAGYNEALRYHQLAGRWVNLKGKDKRFPQPGQVVVKTLEGKKALFHHTGSDMSKINLSDQYDFFLDESHSG